MRIINFGRLPKFLLLALSAPMLLAGCASVEGSQRRVLGTSASLHLVGKYPLDHALTSFGIDSDEARGGLSKQAYRDLVVMLYLNAIDARYHEFRTNLSTESKRTALGLDFALIGLTGWASVAKTSIVNELSAVAGGVAGARATIDKTLYFEKALPALIAAMDAERLNTGAQILRNLQKNAAEYPLALAIIDLNRYEMAGSLDLAIHQVTSEAVKDRDEAKANFENAIRACDTSEAEAELVIEKTELVTATSNRLRAKTPPDVDNLKEMARTMGLGFPGTADAEMLRTLISNELISNYCTATKLDGLLVQLKAKGLAQ